MFLLTVGLLFGFLPGTIDPVAGSQEKPIVADRTVHTLAGSLLGPPTELATVNTSCTIAFFTQSGGTDCGFDTENATVHEQLSVPPHLAVNVTLERDVSGDPRREALCTDGSHVKTCDGDTRLAVGDPVPGAGNSVVTARQTVFVDGKDAIILVRVW